MPFSLLVRGKAATDIPATQFQGTAIQGMFLALLADVAPDVSERLHRDNGYRPYTLSPLGIGDGSEWTQGFRYPPDYVLQRGTPCYFRITLLEDSLYTPVTKFFERGLEAILRLGATDLSVSVVRTYHFSYADLIDRGIRAQQRQISLQFLTPTSFRRGNVDLPIPDPRLVFRSYQKRFALFYQVEFLPDFEEQVEYFTGIARLQGVRTNIVTIENMRLAGFLGGVTFQLDRKTPPALVFQMNLLAEYAYFCGTGRKTTIGMGQTVKR